MVHLTSDTASPAISQAASVGDGGKQSNIKTIPKLLRAIAGSENAKASGHDVIFREAAHLIENHDAPHITAAHLALGDALERIKRLEADLLECQEYFQAHYDVIDGENRQQLPNKEMQLGMMIVQTLNGSF